MTYNARYAVAIRWHFYYTPGQYLFNIYPQLFQEQCQVQAKIHFITYCCTFNVHDS